MKTRLICLTLLTWLVFAPRCSLADEPSIKAFRSKWNVRDHIPLSEFVIQSHRGAGELAPENTLEAFELGWQMGTIPEADVRTTKDGVIVAFHDQDFSRVVKNVTPEMSKKGVEDISFDELSRLDVGVWKGDQQSVHRVSRMTEIYALMKGRPERRLYLDYKNVDLPQMANEVKAFGIEKQVLLASPKHEWIRQWKKLVPESGTLLWVSGTEEAKRKTFETVRQANFEGITQLQMHVRLPGDATDIQPGEPFSPSRKFLAEVGEELAKRKILFQTLPYFATNAITYRQLMDAGVASFSTDHPDVTLKIVREYYSKARP